jgi:hypothetical protein
MANSAAKKSTRKRRMHCYWEPIFDPDLVGKIEYQEWGFDRQKGPEHCHFEGESFTEKLEAGGPTTEKNIVFRGCDFQGFFEPKSQFVFIECHFINCDLSLSTWSKVKFSKCTFDKTSFGQTTFEDCEFRDCSWKEIGFSPNETEFIECWINNVTECVDSAYTNMNIEELSKRRVKPAFQKMKLQETKSTIARMLLRNHRDIGDEKSYYESVKVYETAQSMAKVQKSKYDLTNGSCSARLLSIISLPFWIVENFMLHLFGVLNGWGATVARPVILLASLSLIFSVAYACIPSTLGSSPMQKAFDIAILAGYTNYGSEQDATTLFLQSLHLLTAVVLYTVFFATVAARFSRVR